ncbi:MAG: DUF2184 domain-containing protein [Desulfovibrionaceae bacterium]|nr:DUF2184 domain-containing protein [Desulfovibrionaceae bacterium]
MPKDISVVQAAAYGFIFPGARGWFDPANVARMAQDAAMITNPNTSVPAELLAYIDPAVVEIMTAPRRAREIFREEKKGDWTTPYMKWRVDEMVGKTQPYSDYANGTTSDVNSEWITREQYVFQTSITYGDLEMALSSAAKVNLAASKQRAAATVLDIDQNRFYLLGVAGRNITGILNDPNLPNAITAAATGTGGSTNWSTKSTQQIYNDIRALFAELTTNSNGLIDPNTPLILALSPELAVALGSATDFNISVVDMLRRYFTSLKIVTLPELHSDSAGETVLMIAEEVGGQPTGILAFGEKMRAGRIVPGMSSFRQKFTASTYGGIVRYPFAVAQMTGA